ncbi:MAG: plasmid pRiA4b ORF-3 family protein [Rickettsiales bacterium]|nr:plasmid pRiA4b ORF-3 family protein [Pseudomonadota bacterium]MDA0965522.1 plasmid pRiA4b ORF-3 family protein [Pseudomonadota bacterium]MDG4542846.1 plasmid pRiA4b ORF-3 family protein [Rickettsiales bacterium]MDG4544706.1 plasmid pRiA4b ORF-3 family protein [Rickettsiales bacterium]MDG4546828.1 plasmid pRiA4b ORF-3 family protein [Rickettsiales bacterium]
MGKKAYQLKILLDQSKPPIWRRVLVEPEIKLSKLHDVIQTVFGWEGHHLHQFWRESGDIFDWREVYALPNFGMSEPSPFSDENDKIIDEREVQLDTLLKNEKDKIYYWYDFGDDWEHKIILEKILDDVKEGLELPLCIKGRQACPPDDCGGLWGYYDLLDILEDKKHPEYKHVKAWLKDIGKKDFEPNFFDVDKTNLKLKSYLKKVA